MYGVLTLLHRVVSVLERCSHLNNEVLLEADIRAVHIREMFTAEKCILEWCAY